MAIEFLPWICISYGPPAFSLPSRAIHFPSGPAVVETAFPFSVIFTVSPGSAVPQMGACMPLCKTMWSLNKAAGFISPDAATANTSNRQPVAATKRFCMEPPDVHPARFVQVLNGLPPSANEAGENPLREQFQPGMQAEPNIGTRREPGQISPGSSAITNLRFSELTNSPRRRYNSSGSEIPR